MGRITLDIKNLPNKLSVLCTVHSNHLIALGVSQPLFPEYHFMENAPGVLLQIAGKFIFLAKLQTLQFAVKACLRKFYN